MCLAALSPCLSISRSNVPFSNKTTNEITKASHISTRSTKDIDFIFYSSWRHFLHPESATSVTGIHANCFVFSASE